MADLTLSERLQPSLLDRLTDDAPDRRTEGRDARVIDMRRLREILQRDLSWLLNTYDNRNLVDETRHPHAAVSTLNYGVREVAGEYSTALRAREIRGAIARAVERFEPRLRPETLQVEIRGEDLGPQTVISFDIRAEMWAQPMPMELYLRSAVDITTGEVRLDRPGEGLAGLRAAAGPGAAETTHAPATTRAPDGGGSGDGPAGGGRTPVGAGAGRTRGAG